VIALPVAVLWSVAVFIPWPKQAALVLPAVLLENLVSAIIALPIGDWFLRGAPRKAVDTDNFAERLSGFFIIVLGEGVYDLVSGNDWGEGFSEQVVFGIQALIVYYSLFWLFFTRDQTKTFIHAVHRSQHHSLAFQT
jgi:low temperature requirement protein LtrA